MVLSQHQIAPRTSSRDFYADQPQQRVLESANMGALVQILRQLRDVAGAGHSVLSGLAQLTQTTATRVETLRTRVSALQYRARSLGSELQEHSPLELQAAAGAAEAPQYKVAAQLTSNLFHQSRTPVRIAALRQSAEAPPDFSHVDADGESARKFSDPHFFVRRWFAAEQRRQEELAQRARLRKQKRRRKKGGKRSRKKRAVASVQRKRFDAHGIEIAPEKAAAAVVASATEEEKEDEESLSTMQGDLYGMSPMVPPRPPTQRETPPARPPPTPPKTTTTQKTTTTETTTATTKPLPPRPPPTPPVVQVPPTPPVAPPVQRVPPTPPVQHTGYGADTGYNDTGYNTGYNDTGYNTGYSDDTGYGSTGYATAQPPVPPTPPPVVQIPPEPTLQRSTSLVPPAVGSPRAATPKAGGGMASDLLSQIRGGKKLRKMERASAATAASGGNDLLSQIRGGANLRKVERTNDADKDDGAPVGKDAGLMGNITGNMDGAIFEILKRRNAIAAEESDDSDDSDSEWEDDDD